MLGAQEERQPWTIGLALSGGAALGLAHVGVLKVFEEEGIPISYISGTSMGAIVAGMFAAGYSASEMDSILTTVDWNSIFSDRIPANRMTLARREERERNIIEVTHNWFVLRIPSGVVSLQNVEILLTDLLAEREFDAGYNFDSLTIPFRCVATDVMTGDSVIFSKGSMVDAIRSSIAIPAVFSPAKIDGHYYIDGGAVMNLPVQPLLEFKPDFIIASDVIRWTSEARSMIDVVTRTMAIVTEPNRREQRKLASVVLYPNVDSFLPSEFARASEIVAAGEPTARLAVPAIKQKLVDHPLVLKRNPLYPRPKPVVREIRIQGLKVTRELLVRREIATHPGDTLDFKLLVADLERLRETGLFKHVSHRLEFAGSDVDVIFDLEEKDYGLYGFSAYYDNVYGFAVRVEACQGNLLGTGARLGLTVSLGEPRDIRFGLTGSRLRVLPFTYRLEAYRNVTRHFFYDKGIWFFDYFTWTWGADAEFGYAIGRRGYFTFGYEHRRHFHQLPPLSGEENLRETVSGPTFRLRASSLDDLLFPMKGFDFMLQSKFGVPTYSLPQSFLKVRGRAEGYFPFGERVVLGTGLEYGLGIDTLPRAEVFRLGGDDLVGARQDEFTTNEYLKASLLLGYKFFDLLNNPRYSVRLELTTDLAVLNPFLYGTFPEYQTFMGVGVGAAGNTPIGPVRVIFGISSTRQVSFRFAVGIPPRERM